jgi:glycosyltransferase involved in cell wall biosynthesis
MSERGFQSIRICFATTEYPPHVGGIARSAHRLASRLVQSGFEICVFTLPAKNRTTSTTPVNVDGTIVYTVPSTLDGIIQMIREVDNIRSFDLFHGFPLVAAFPCLRVASEGGRPVIASIRGIDGMEFNDVALTVLRESSWITSVSRDSISRAMAHVDISSRSSFIPNSTEVKYLPKWRPSAVNEGVVGTVATFRPKKNIPLLIQAYSETDVALRKKLLLVGDFFDGNNIDYAQMHRINGVIKELKLDSEVTITGYINNARISEYLLSMRVFVLSSDHEGLPNSILEAAAVGVPIVTTAVDGVKDIFTSGEDALFVPPKDSRKLAAAIREVLTDVDLACRLSKGARDTMARLTPEAEKQAYVDLYKQLLNTNR